jgi:hypothetical protein
MKRFLTRPLIIGIVGGVTAIGLFGAIALAQGSRAPKAHLNAHKRYAHAASTTADAASVFPAFQRSRSASDDVPSSVTSRFNQTLGLDPSQSRLIANTSDATVWLVPATSVMCAVIQYKNVPQAVSNSAAGLACDTVAKADSTGLLAVFNHQLVVGAVPSGTTSLQVDSTAGATSIAANQGGGVVYQGANPVSGVTFTDPNGQHQNIDNTAAGAPAP